jgi:hypothetical protein
MALRAEAFSSYVYVKQGETKIVLDDQSILYTDRLSYCIAIGAISKFNRDKGIYAERQMLHDVCGQLLFDHPFYEPMIKKFFKDLNDDTNFVIGFGFTYPSGEDKKFCEKTFTDRLVECGINYKYNVLPEKLKFFYTRTDQESDSMGTFKLNPDGQASMLLSEEISQLPAHPLSD